MGNNVTETTRGQDIKYSQLSAARKRALQANATKKLTEDELSTISTVKPVFNKAVKKAEGNKRNFGVLGAKNPVEANNILNQSIYNNYVRWIQAGKPGTFTDFMRDRWAPIGVANDPNNLNVNWNNNVRGSILNQLGPEEYEKWKRLNLVRAMLTNGYV